MRLTSICFVMSDVVQITKKGFYFIENTNYTAFRMFLATLPLVIAKGIKKLFLRGILTKKLDFFPKGSMSTFAPLSFSPWLF